MENKVCKKCGRTTERHSLYVKDEETYYCSTACVFVDYTEEEYDLIINREEAYWTK